jgi:hypothetical protein
VEQDVLGVEPGGQRDRQLTGRRDIAPEPLLGEDPRQRCARERLGREVHVGVGVAGGERLQVLARGLAQPLLVGDERGRAEFGRDVGERHPADREPAVSVLGAAGQDLEEPFDDHGRSISGCERRCQLEDRRNRERSPSTLTEHGGGSATALASRRRVGQLIARQISSSNE